MPFNFEKENASCLGVVVLLMTKFSQLTPENCLTIIFPSTSLIWIVSDRGLPRLCVSTTTKSRMVEFSDGASLLIKCIYKNKSVGACPRYGHAKEGWLDGAINTIWVTLSGSSLAHLRKYILFCRHSENF